MIVRALASVMLLVLAACSEAAPVGGVPAGDLPSATARSTGSSTAPSAGALRPSEGFALSRIVFTNGERSIPMPVLVADNPALRSVGLMNRTTLPDDAGMLFVFEDPTAGAFWMKNTLLPLSIAFVGQDGRVQQVIDMDPCTADPCPRYGPDTDYVHAVEANQGYYEARGITAGWSLEVDGGIGGGR